MEAARVAARRGHKVTLAEAGPDLGGTLDLASRAPTRQQFKDFLIWLQDEIYAEGVNVRLSTYVTEADLNAKFQEIAEQTGKHVAKVKADYQEAQRDALESQLLEEKVMALLAERANIREGEPPESSEPAETPEEASETDADEGEES